MITPALVIRTVVPLGLMALFAYCLSTGSMLAAFGVFFLLACTL